MFFWAGTGRRTPSTHGIVLLVDLLLTAGVSLAIVLFAGPTPDGFLLWDLRGLLLTEVVAFGAAFALYSTLLLGQLDDAGWALAVAYPVSLLGAFLTAALCGRIWLG